MSFLQIWCFTSLASSVGFVIAMVLVQATQIGKLRQRVAELEAAPRDNVIHLKKAS